MRSHHWFLLGALAVGGYFAWKYRANIMAAVAPDPTVTSLAGSTFDGAQDVPGTITGAMNRTGSASSSYDPLTGTPAQNAALTLMLA